MTPRTVTLHHLHPSEEFSSCLRMLRVRIKRNKKMMTAKTKSKRKTKVRLTPRIVKDHDHEEEDPSLENIEDPGHETEEQDPETDITDTEAREI